jgi:hypothetical protein
VQVLVMMPLFLFAIVAGIKLWEVMMIRRSLNTGTYLATRYLSLYPPATINDLEWDAIARRLVWSELYNNPFVDRTRINDVTVPVDVTLIDGSNQCTDKFLVTAEYEFFGPRQNSQFMLPDFTNRLSLREERRGEVLCD